MVSIHDSLCIDTCIPSSYVYISLQLILCLSSSTHADRQFNIQCTLKFLHLSLFEWLLYVLRFARFMDWTVQSMKYLHKEQIHACFEQHNPLNPLFAYNITIYTSSTMHAQINIHIPNKQLLSSVVSLWVSKWLALLWPTGYHSGLQHNLVVQ